MGEREVTWIVEGYGQQIFLSANTKTALKGHLPLKLHIVNNYHGHVRMSHTFQISHAYLPTYAHSQLETLLIQRDLPFLEQFEIW